MVRIKAGGLILGRDMQYVDSRCIHVNRDGVIESIESHSTCANNYIGSSRFILIPQPANSHTHLADWVIPEYGTQMSLSELVAPPDGLKHRYLRKLGTDEKIRGYTEALNYVSATGSGLVIDYREEGVKGCRIARNAYDRSTFKQYGTLKLLGRPAGSKDFKEEVLEVLSTCDGLGLSSPLDYSEEELKILGTMKREDTIISAHIAETPATREEGDLELLLQYVRPRFIVHGTFLKPGDLGMLREMEIPIAVCPRSVMFHSNGVPPVKEFYSHGITLLVGSDNAAWFTPDPWRDVEQLYYIGRSQGLKDVGLEKWILHGLLIAPYETVGINPPVIDEGLPLRGLLIDGEDTGIRLAQNKYAGIIKRVDRSAVKGVILGTSMLGDIIYRGLIKTTR